MFRENLKTFLVSIAVMLAIAAFYAFPRFAPGPPETRADAPGRIVSITPAGTEILFDLGLGDRVAAVTKYCTWPPEAREKPQLGDMMSVSLESLAVLSPDLVVISNMNETLRSQAEKMGYATVSVNQDNFSEICASMLRVGEACGVPETASKRVAGLRESVREISGAAEKSAATPRVLVCVGRDPADTAMKSLYVAGARSFYEDLLEAAGAKNAFERGVPYAQISMEGLLRTDPDIVLELIGESGMEVTMTTGKILEPWEKITGLRAARDGNIAVIRGDFVLRAGPRYPKALGAFIRAIHGGEREINEE